MSRYFYFSPEEVIRKYFHEFSGSLQNKSHTIALEYSQKVENLRENIALFLGVRNSHWISFQFNKYYVNRLIFQNLDLLESWRIFTDNFKLQKKFINSDFFSLNKIRSFIEKNNEVKKTLIWIDELKHINLELFEAVEKLIRLKNNQEVYTYLSLDYLIYKIPKIRVLMKEFSFLVFRPDIVFQEYGIVIFAFKKSLNLKPVFLGSNSAEFNKNAQQFELNPFPQVLEIGTQNLISLLILERYFYFLNTYFEEIKKTLKSPNLNFNLRKNLKLL